MIVKTGQDFWKFIVWFAFDEEFSVEAGLLIHKSGKLTSFLLVRVS